MRKDSYDLTNLLKPSIEAMGYVLWGVEYHPNSKNAILRIYIDKEDGISIDDCELVSRQITGILDVHDPIKIQYTLEVSSPGLDRLFFYPEQFEHYLNNVIHFQLHSAINNRRRFEAKLVELQEENLIVNLRLDNKKDFLNESFTIPIDNIDRARLVPEL